MCVCVRLCVHDGLIHTHTHIIHTRSRREAKFQFQSIVLISLQIYRSSLQEHIIYNNSYITHTHHTPYIIRHTSYIVHQITYTSYTHHTHIIHTHTFQERLTSSTFLPTSNGIVACARVCVRVCVCVCVYVCVSYMCDVCVYVHVCDGYPFHMGG